jgi:tungstate transport system ATP-binding protein
MADTLNPFLLQLTGVSVRFGEVMALSDIHLGIAPGEVVALVGSNGSGKTTLLRALHGKLSHSGERRVREADGQGRPLVQRMVYQRPFMLRLSALNNLRLALWLGGVPRHLWTARAEQALQRVGLAGLGSRPARAMSGGQQQRLALARAWAVQPDVLFLDEPTASLDPTAKKEVETLLEGFAAEGTTLVMSTHNLGQAKRLARRVVYLDAGRIVVDEPAESFFSDAAHTGDGVRSAGITRLNSFLKGELTWHME